MICYIYVCVCVCVCVYIKVLQARMLEWVAMSSSRGSSQLRDWTQSPAWQANSLKSEPPGKPCYISSTQNIVQGRRMEAQALNTFISWDLTKKAFQQRSEEGERKLRQIFRGREFMGRTATTESLGQKHVWWVWEAVESSHTQSRVSKGMKSKRWKRGKTVQGPRDKLVNRCHLVLQGQNVLKIEYRKRRAERGRRSRHSCNSQWEMWYWKF